MLDHLVAKSMADIQFNVSSLLASGSQTYSLASLISVHASQSSPAVLALRVYDRDVYSGVQSYDYGYFTSPNGGHISAGTQYRLTTLYFDLHGGQYLSRDTGEALSAYNFTASGENYRSVYLSLFTDADAGANYNSNWLDPAWTHLSDVDVVTRSNYVDATPNSATPQELAALAKTFIGKVWNSEGCWLLASNISAAAGASLPAATGRLGTAGLSGNGQWALVFDGGQQSGDWRALLQPGDMVEMGFAGGSAHIATVTSGSGHNALWVDNSGPSANDGVASDIVIQGEHSVDDATHRVIDSTVVIFRLAQASATPATVIAPVAPPVLTAYSQSLQVGHSLSLASLFSVRDPNLLPMVSYQILDQSGGGHIQLNGAVNLATPAQQQAGTVIVGASDFAKLGYVATLGPDALTITAFNGQAWGSANLTVTGWVDPPPTVSGGTIALHASSQNLPVSSLFSAHAAAGHSLTEYRFLDSDHSGQLILSKIGSNLASNEEAALGIYRISASDLGTVNWKVLADSGSFSVAAFDGVQWSDYAAVTVAGQNNAPTVTPLPRLTLQVGQAMPLTRLFSLSDVDLDAVTMVSIYDYHQNIQLNGAHDYCPLDKSYEVTTADLAQLTYTAPNNMGGVQGVYVYAYDGTSWSDPVLVLFSVADPQPVVEPKASAQLSLQQAVPLQELFLAVDPNGQTITQYQVQDPAGGGSLQLNGAANLATAAQQAQGITIFAAGDLARVSYVAAAQVGSETLAISAYNGSLWGSNNIPVYSTDSASPVLRTPPAILDVGQTAALSDLCAASSPSGRAITQYLIRDPSGSGSLQLNGATNLASSAQQGVLVAAADFAKLQYLASASDSSEVLSISAFDGGSWGQADLLLSSRNFDRPVVTAIPLTVHAGQAVSLQDLFRVSDANGTAMRNYQINDTGQHLQLNGAVNIWASQQYQGVYGIDARDLQKVVFVAGDPGVETIYIEASDLHNSSMMVAETITVLPNPVITPTTVNLAVHQTIALGSLFVATNPSGKTLLQYKVVDPAGGGTLYLNGAADLASPDEQAQAAVVVAAGDLGKLTYKGGNSFGNENLLVAAYDGDSWGSSEIPVTTIDGTPPVLAVPAARVEVDQTVALDSLFSATSHAGQPISLYKIVNPLGGGKLVLNGATDLASPAQQAQEGMTIVAAADLGRLQYVGADTPGSESLTLSAYDGQSWGTASLSIASVRTAPPVLAPVTAYLEPGQAVSLGSLFSVSAGQAVSYYIFQDSSGNIRLNGASNLWASQQASGYYWIRGADLASVSYVPSQDGVFHFTAIVNDGFNFSSWSQATAVVGKDRLSLPPSILPASTTLALGQTVPFASLFAVQDPIGNAIFQYSVLDPAGGGRLLANGATDLATPSQHAQGWQVYAATDFDKLQYQGGTSGGTESLSISAYDGVATGSADIAVSSALLPPLITAATTAVELSQKLNLSALFSVQTASGRAISQYKIQDPGGGGSILLNDAANLADAAQQAQGISIISASDLPRVQYAAAAATGSETLLIAASDGQSWGARNIAVTTTDHRPPTLRQTASADDLGATVWLSSFFSGSSVSGKPIIEYLIQDPAGGGQVGINTARDLATAAQHSQGIMVVADYDLDALLYTGATSPGSETLVVTAYDGENSVSANIGINSVTPVLPVVTPKPLILHSGDAIALSDLFSVADANGYPIAHYMILDPDLGLRLNGAANGLTSPTADTQGHYYLYAADWGKVQYLAAQPGTVRIGIQVDDGHNVSAYVEETITTVAAGSDQSIVGDASFNTVAYNGLRANFAIARSGSQYSVHDAAGRTELLGNIGHIMFSDKSVNLLVQADAASIPAAKLNSLVELYVAYFNRVPDADGLVYWIDQYKAGQSLEQIGTAFYAAAIQYAADTSYSSDMSNADFVKMVYSNVLGRSGNNAPPDSDVNYWANNLASGGDTRGTLINTMLAAAHGFKGDASWGWVSDLLDNKVAVGKIFAVGDGLTYNSASDSIAHGMAIAAAVTATGTDHAIALIGVTDAPLYP